MSPAPWFLLLLTASAWAIDSNRSLLSARDVENIRAAKAYAAECKGSRTKVGKIHTHVYHIYEGGSGYGLQEHNAGDVLGDIFFVFGVGGGAEYYKGGYIAMLHIGVTQWGQYLRCNHPQGSHIYSCGGGDYPFAGRTGSGRDTGTWYSFPAIGKDKQWSEMDDKTGPCMMIRIKAKCLFNNMAKAGSCPNGCDSVPSYGQCAECWSSLSTAQMQQIWDNAIWNKKCKRYETEEEEEEIDEDDELTDDVHPDQASSNATALMHKGGVIV